MKIEFPMYGVSQNQVMFIMITGFEPPVNKMYKMNYNWWSRDRGSSAFAIVQPDYIKLKPGNKFTTGNMGIIEYEQVTEDEFFVLLSGTFRRKDG